MIQLEQIKLEIKNILKEQAKDVDVVIEKPKNRAMGDYAVPCFSYAKIFHQNPKEVACFIQDKMKLENYEKIEVVNGYLNIFLKKEETSKEVLNTILSEKENYGASTIGSGKTIVIDYSAPNIAKPFGVGHLRSTVIGNSLCHIAKKLGYQVVAINHLGDWGTQFGKLIYAYKTWGDENKVKENTIDELRNLYVKFHEEAKLDPTLDEQGRYWFKKLEDGDEEARRLWKWFREESLKEFDKTYQLLQIDTFDSYHGESFYNDKMDAVIEELQNKKLLQCSEGASIVDLGEEMAPALIKRSDGATLYITRDLAAVFYRKEIYHFDEALYVVGNEQQLHFEQLKQVLCLMGYDWSKDVKHIPFGLILQDGKKMSTRGGRSVKLHDVLLDAITLARDYVENHGMIENKEEVSRQIGVGAVIFNDLKNFRTNDIEFHLEDILKFEGETGPYIQYTYARIQSLLNSKKIIDIHTKKVIMNEYIWNIIFQLHEFQNTIERAKENYDPSEIAKYLLDLAQDFNRFYANQKIIDDDLFMTQYRIRVSEATAIVLKEGMRLLGIDMPDKM